MYQQQQQQQQQQQEVRPVSRESHEPTRARVSFETLPAVMPQGPSNVPPQQFNQANRSSFMNLLPPPTQQEPIQTNGISYTNGSEANQEPISIFSPRPPQQEEEQPTHQNRISFGGLSAQQPEHGMEQQVIPKLEPQPVPPQENRISFGNINIQPPVEGGNYENIPQETAPPAPEPVGTSMESLQPIPEPKRISFNALPIQPMFPEMQNAPPEEQPLHIETEQSKPSHPPISFGGLLAPQSTIQAPAVEHHPEQLREASPLPPYEPPPPPPPSQQQQEEHLLAPVSYQELPQPQKRRLSVTFRDQITEIRPPSTDDEVNEISIYPLLDNAFARISLVLYTHFFVLSSFYFLGGERRKKIEK